jgi:hypothetical protein
MPEFEQMLQLPPYREARRSSTLWRLIFIDIDEASEAPIPMVMPVP